MNGELLLAGMQGRLPGGKCQHQACEVLAVIERVDAQEDAVLRVLVIERPLFFGRVQIVEVIDEVHRAARGHLARYMQALGRGGGAFVERPIIVGRGERDEVAVEVGDGA